MAIHNIEKAGFGYFELELRPGLDKKSWLCPQTGQPLRVEKAVLSHFEAEGWRGFAGEGGLILNLIVAMSYKDLPEELRRYRASSLYHDREIQHVADPSRVLQKPRRVRLELLENIRRATAEEVARNFQLMIWRGPPRELPDGTVYYPGTSFESIYPGLEAWMILELLGVAGCELMYNVAAIFAQDPFRYNKGWPDITMWRDDELRFVEVKAPGDRLIPSQKIIAAEIAAPLRLDFRLAAVLGSVDAPSDTTEPRYKLNL